MKREKNYNKISEHADLTTSVRNTLCLNIHTYIHNWSLQPFSQGY